MGDPSLSKPYCHYMQGNRRAVSVHNAAAYQEASKAYDSPVSV